MTSMNSIEVAVRGGKCVASSDIRFASYVSICQLLTRGGFRCCSALQAVVMCART